MSYRHTKFPRSFRSQGTRIFRLAGVSSRQQVNVVSPATVGGVAYSNSAFDAVGTRETLALTQATPGAAPVSVAGNDGKVLLVPVMPGNQFYMSVGPIGVPAPTHWDLYARPYYRCRIRLVITGTNSTPIYSPSQTPQINTAAGAITVTVYYLIDSSSPPLPDQILGFPDINATKLVYTQASFADAAKVWPTAPGWMTYTSTATGDRNLLVIDVKSMVAALGSGSLAQTAPELYSIYIGSSPTTEPATPPSPLPPPIRSLALRLRTPMISARSPAAYRL